jgi:HAD superfamily hydrolase (TIGR01459 family)
MRIRRGKYMQESFILTHFQNLIGRHDCFIMDGWHMLHDGIDAYEGVIETLSYIKSLEKKVLFLVNSPRQGETIENLLLNYHITPEHYDFIWTSADQMILAARSHTPPFTGMGTLCYVIDNAFDGKLMNDGNFIFVDDLTRASFLLMMSVAPNDDAHDECIEIMKRGISLNLPMVCPNPTAYAVSGKEIILKAGYYAYEYIKMGGQVHFYGKPSHQIFEEVHNIFPFLPKHKVAVVGNQMMVDIIGAKHYGFKTIFVVQDKKYGDYFKLDDTVSRYKYDSTSISPLTHAVPTPDYLVPEFRLGNILEKTLGMAAFDDLFDVHVSFEKNYIA